MVSSTNTSCSSASQIKLEPDAIIISTTKDKNNRSYESLHAKHSKGKIISSIAANNLLVAHTSRYPEPNSNQLELYKIGSSQGLTKCATLPVESFYVEYDFNGNQIVLFNAKQITIYDLSHNNFKLKAALGIFYPGETTCSVHWLPDGNHFYFVTPQQIIFCTLINSFIKGAAILTFIPFNYHSYLAPKLLPLGEIICGSDYDYFELYDPYAPLPEWRVLSKRPTENCKLYKIGEKSFYLPAREVSELDRHFNKEFICILISIIGLNNLPVVLLNIICSYISLDRAQPIPSCLSYAFCFFQPTRQIGVPSGAIVKKLNLLEDKLNITIRKLNSEEPKEGSDEKERIAQIELKTKILLVASEFKELLKNRMDMSYNDIFERVSERRNAFLLLNEDKDRDVIDLEQSITLLNIYLDSSPRFII